MSGTVVVGNGWIVHTTGRSQLLGEGWRLSDVAVAANQLGAGVAYVANWDDGNPAVEIEGYTITPTGGDEGEHWRWRVASTAQGIACAPTGQAMSLGTACEVVDLAHDVTGAAGSWEGLGPRGLLDAFAAFQRLTGVPWGSSVGRTAQHLILASHPRVKGGTALDREPNIPEPVQGSTLEMPWSSWRRDLTAAEEAARYVHVFDANAQYLGAWGVVELGHGQPIHRTGRVTFDKNSVGFWRIPHADLLQNMTPRLPAPWLLGREWFSTPTVTRMLEVCDGLEAPEIAEAWVWPQHSRFLRAPAETLRDARRAAIETAAAARLAVPLADDQTLPGLLTRVTAADCVLDAVKSIYRVQTGRFGMDARAGTPWGRPDWGHTIRAQARVNLHRRLTKLGAAPIAIATDGLVFLDDEPDPLVFARRIGLTIGDGLGEFHHDATAPADVVHANNVGSAGALLAAIATYGETVNHV